MVFSATDLPDPVVPGDQQMRHLGQIGHHRLAADGFAQRKRQRRTRFLVFGAGKEFAQINRFAPRIGKLDADYIAPGNNRDARSDRAH